MIDIILNGPIIIKHGVYVVKSMKKTICSIFLLILIHISLFQTNGLLYLNDNQVPNINMDMDQSHSVYDVDREIVPVQEPTSNLL